MATSAASVTFQHILIPTDFSGVSQRALQYAKSVASRGDSELLVVHVNQPVDLITPPEAAWVDVAEIQNLEKQQLEQSVAALRSEGYRSRAISLTGPLYKELLAAIERYQVNLIVLGTHGKKGLERLLLGSDAEALLRRAHCPVISIGPNVPPLQHKAWRLREVLCATTLEPRSAEVAAYAHKLAAQQGAKLVMLHVKDLSSEEHEDWASFDAAFHSFAGEVLTASSWLCTRVAATKPGINIVDLARQRGSDLIVLGARKAPSMATHLAAGVVTQVILEAPCPVMTLLQP